MQATEHVHLAVQLSPGPLSKAMGSGQMSPFPLPPVPDGPSSFCFSKFDEAATSGIVHCSPFGDWCVSHAVSSRFLSVPHIRLSLKADAALMCPQAQPIGCHMGGALATLSVVLHVSCQGSASVLLNIVLVSLLQLRVT